MTGGGVGPWPLPGGSVSPSRSLNLSDPHVEIIPTWYGCHEDYMRFCY